jgi:hypothetical protein
VKARDALSSHNRPYAGARQRTPEAIDVFFLLKWNRKKKTSPDVLVNDLERRFLP